LLFLNAALFAYGQGYFGAGSGNEHEPTRLKRQFNTPKLTLLNAEQAAVAAKASSPPAGGDAADAAAQAASPAPAPPSAPAPGQKALACLDVGSFGGGDARRFEARLAALGLADRIPAGRQSVQSQDVSSWLVHIPPQPNKEAAERKAAELRNLGVTNFFIMQGESPMKYAISLGVFKTETGAQTLLAQLGKQGVHSARIAPRGPQAIRFTYRLRNLDEATRKRVAAYAERFEDVEAKSCGT
jgi:cell division septation protein DedD